MFSKGPSKEAWFSVWFYWKVLESFKIWSLLRSLWVSNQRADEILHRFLFFFFLCLTSLSLWGEEWLLQTHHVGVCSAIGPGAMGPTTRAGNFRNRAVDGLRCFVTVMESWLALITWSALFLQPHHTAVVIIITSGFYIRLHKVPLALFLNLNSLYLYICYSTWIHRNWCQIKSHTIFCNNIDWTCEDRHLYIRYLNLWTK